MKKQVLDELSQIIEIAKKSKKVKLNEQEERNFKYVDPKKMWGLIHEWSQKIVYNLPNGTFPKDIIRKIFKYMSAKDYYRLAHGLCRKTREWIKEDITILKLTLQYSPSRSGVYFYPFYNVVYKNDIGTKEMKIRLGKNIEKLKRGYFAQRGVSYRSKSLDMSISNDHETSYSTFPLHGSRNYNPVEFSPNEKGNYLLKYESIMKVETYWKSAGKIGFIKSASDGAANSSSFAYVEITFLKNPTS